MDIDSIREALKYIDPASYEDWIKVGMALKAGGYDESVWEEWSKGDRIGYHPGECQKKWDSFNGNGVSEATVFWMAQNGGYRPGDFLPEPSRGPIVSREEDFELNRDYVLGQRDTDPGHLVLPPWKQLLTYLEHLYDPADVISYVTTDVYEKEGGKYAPLKGQKKTAGEIEEILKETHDIAKAVGEWVPACGAWIRLNTYTKENGVGNSDVQKFRYVLVECDNGTAREQEQKLRDLRLPIAALVLSGKRSVHAIVRIDAKDYPEYRERVEFLYGHLKAKGLDNDPADKNPSRLSRMPGVTRDGEVQSLLALNVGLKDWRDWRHFAETGRLPSKIEYPMQATEYPVLAPELLGGILRKGHKMLVSGASKSAKSFFLIELGMAVSQGMPFLGIPTKKERVLYINLEIDTDSCNERIMKIRDAMGAGRDPEGYFAVKNMRGDAMPLPDLVTRIVQEYKTEGFGLVILDPLYKIMVGDENSATDMGRLANEFDRLCESMGCSVVYAHHHSKGGQGGKTALDRASGSGVFARDPDAILDLTELEISKDLRDEYALGEDVRGWNMDIVTRDFRMQPAKKIFFNYPVHEIDTEGILDRCTMRGTAQYDAEQKAAAKHPGGSQMAQMKLREKETEVLDAFKKLGTDTASAAEILDILAPESEGPKTRENKKKFLQRLVKTSEKFEILEHKIHLKSGA